MGLPFLLVLSAVALGLPSSPTYVQQGAQETPRFLISSDLVVLRVGVTDQKQGLVSGLTKEDFIVYEDGVPQEIGFFSRDDLPVTVGIVVDNSGSMWTKRDRVIAGALSFAGGSNPLDEMFVVNFNEHVRFGLPDANPFTSDIAVLRAGLLAGGARGRTGLYDAVSAALDHAERGTHDQKVIVVLSDGGDNASRTTLDELLEKARASTAVIYTIGLFAKEDRDANPDALRKLADVSGGEWYVPRNVKAVQDVLDRVAHDIRNVYTLGYVSTNTQTTGYRKLRVNVKAPAGKKVHVRAREGYTVGDGRRAKS
jgi:Ca-activated chloride channel homolog